MERVIGKIQDNNTTQMIVLCNSREQCDIMSIQIKNIKPDINMYVMGTTTRDILPVIKQRLLNNPQIVVGTVPRIYDLIDRGFIKTFHINSYIVCNRQEIEERGFKYFLDCILPQNIDILSI